MGMFFRFFKLMDGVYVLWVVEFTDGVCVLWVVKFLFLFCFEKVKVRLTLAIIVVMLNNQWFRLISFLFPFISKMKF